MIFIEADLRRVTDVAESWYQIAQDFQKQRNLDTIIGFVAETASQSFNEMMDAHAPGEEAKLGHMYDWGQLGQEAGRLWRILIAGTSRVKVVTWDYKESRNEVPVGVNEEDTRRGGHVYRWKAPMIENGTRVRIEPVNREWLAIPTSEGGNVGRNKSEGGTMWFTKRAISPPINRIAQGAFTEAWLMHFNTIAVKLADSTIGVMSEEFFDGYEKEYSRLPQPKVNPKPMRSKLHYKSNFGQNMARRKNGQFMSKLEAAQQVLQAQRIGDGLD